MKIKIATADVSSSLDYGYSNIQNTYEGKASDLMFFPTGSFEWIKNFTKSKNGPK
jgi:hypothetical protein